MIGVVRQGWRSLTFAGEAGPVAPLPPPGRRPQPRTAAAPPAGAPDKPRRSWESDVLTRARAALELRFAAAGIALYAGAVTLLLSVGAADGGAAATGWAARDALLVAFALVALLVARSWSSGSEPSPVGRERLACALLGAGAVWLELGILDQHLFGLFEIAHGSLVWDGVFHGAGVAVFVAGWALLVAGTDGLRRRAWRHAPSTAS